MRDEDDVSAVMVLQDEMALAIGRMTMAWSRFHYQLYDLHQMISTDRMTDHREFFEVPTDSHSRNVVMKSFESKLGKDHPLVVRLRSVLAESDHLGEHRNAFIHTPLWETEGIEGIQAQQGWRRPRPHHYRIKQDALADCKELHCQIEVIENIVYNLIDDAIVVLMVESSLRGGNLIAS